MTTKTRRKIDAALIQSLLKSIEDKPGMRGAADPPADDVSGSFTCYHQVVHGGSASDHTQRPEQHQIQAAIALEILLGHLWSARLAAQSPKN